MWFCKAVEDNDIELSEAILAALKKRARGIMPKLVYPFIKDSADQGRIYDEVLDIMYADMWREAFWSYNFNHMIRCACYKVTKNFRRRLEHEVLLPLADGEDEDTPPAWRVLLPYFVKCEEFDMHVQLEEALRDLRPEVRTAILWCYRQGIPIWKSASVSEAIACILEIQPRQARNHTKRMKELLRGYFQDDPERP